MHDFVLRAFMKVHPVSACLVPSELPQFSMSQIQQGSASSEILVHADMTASHSYCRCVSCMMGVDPKALPSKRHR